MIQAIDQWKLSSHMRIVSVCVQFEKPNGSVARDNCVPELVQLQIQLYIFILFLFN